MSYKDLSDRFLVSWWYAALAATGAVFNLLSAADHLDDGRWGRAVLDVLFAAFFAYEAGRTVRAKLARQP